MSEIGESQSSKVAGEDIAGRPELIHHDVELILARQLAGYLAVPIIIIDPKGTVVFYNEPAERILGRRFDEGGPIPPGQWTAAFEFRDEAGSLVPHEKMPLAAALRTRTLVHMNMSMRGLDGTRHRISEAGIPLIGNGRRFVGVLAFLFELDD